VPEDEGGLGLVRVQARAAVANVASRGALTRAGFREVGTEKRSVRLRGGFADAVLLEA
jgi:RimJ/RimL family protein N-acetyltransferase